MRSAPFEREDLASAARATVGPDEVLVVVVADPASSHGAAVIRALVPERTATGTAYIVAPVETVIGTGLLSEEHAAKLREPRPVRCHLPVRAYWSIALVGGPAQGVCPVGLRPDVTARGAA